MGGCRNAPSVVPLEPIRVMARVVDRLLGSAGALVRRADFSYWRVLWQGIGIRTFVLRMGGAKMSFIFFRRFDGDCLADLLHPFLPDARRYHMKSTAVYAWYNTEHLTYLVRVEK